jgi:hypothetical protein
MLNKPGDGEAIVEYLDADYTVLRPGRFVRCAITGKPIALDALRYWNVDKQEAYVDARASMIGFGYSSEKWRETDPS